MQMQKLPPESHISKSSSGRSPEVPETGCWLNTRDPVLCCCDKQDPGGAKEEENAEYGFMRAVYYVRTRLVDV